MGNPRTDWCFTDRARARPQRPRAQLSARQGAGRLLGHQRHDLHARPGGRLRPLAPARQCRAGPGTTCCPTSSARRTTSQGAGPFHGAGGEWRIEPPASVLGRSSTPSARPPAECGIPKTDDFNRGDNEGCGYFQVTQRRGIRWTTAKAFLRPARGRPNLAVVTGAQVDRPASSSGRRCTGVAFLEGWAPKRAARAPRGDPGGRCHRLAAAPAAVRHRPGRRTSASMGSRSGTSCRASAGNLQDHLQLRLVYKVQGTVDPERARRPPARHGRAWPPSMRCSAPGP